MKELFEGLVGDYCIACNTIKMHVEHCIFLNAIFIMFISLSVHFSMRIFFSDHNYVSPPLFLPCPYVRLSVRPSGCLSVCHTSFPLNNSSTL